MIQNLEMRSYVAKFRISESREVYWSHKKEGERFSSFNDTNIAMYALMFHDDTITVDTAKYVTQIMIIFDLLAAD